MTQTEFSSFKLLLKQLYTAHSSKIKELENEIKVLKEKLIEKERENNASLTECKRCIELEEAFKSCKKALHDQSKMFEKFGQKFSIFNSPGIESQDSKCAKNLSNDSPEKTYTEKFKNASFLDKDESTLLSLGGNAIAEIKINATDKVPVLSNNKNLLKKVMHDENFDSFDVCTVTLPQHLKQGLHSAKFDSLVLAPDSLDVSLDNRNICEKKYSKNQSKHCTSKTELKSNEDGELKDNVWLQDNKGSGKRLSPDSLNDDRFKRCNTGKQGEITKNVDTISKLKTKDTKNCNNIPPKIMVTQETSDISLYTEKKSSAIMKDANVLDVSVPKKKLTNETVDIKNETTTNPNSLSIVNKIKLHLKETSPSLLLKKANALPKIIHLEDISNDDDFQDEIPNMKNVQNEDSWDACDKKKSIKNQRNIKSIKTTSKYKMTLDAPPLNYKKTTYKQTKLSKSIFQPKNSTSNKKSSARLLEVENINPTIMEEDSSSAFPHNHFLASTPYDAMKSPSAIDIDATFLPENFHLENKVYATTNVKKNAIEKSHLKNGSLFSNISFPEEMQSPTSENLIQADENVDHSDCVDVELKENMDSFDRLPLPEEPAYKYKNDVVRKKSERRQLNGFDCKECEKYYSELGLSDKEKKERMKKCSRHRGKFTPPATPAHFWELEFPDTEECKARGYLNATQKVKLNNICNL